MSCMGSVAAHSTEVFEWLMYSKTFSGIMDLIFVVQLKHLWEVVLTSSSSRILRAPFFGQLSPRWSYKSQELSLAFRGFSFWKKVDTVNNLKGFFFWRGIYSCDITLRLFSFLFPWHGTFWSPCHCCVWKFAQRDHYAWMQLIHYSFLWVSIFLFILIRSMLPYHFNFSLCLNWN